MSNFLSFDVDFATLNDNAKIHRQHLDNIQYVSGATRMTDFMNVKTVTDYNYEIVWATNSVSDVYSGSSKFVRWVLGKLQLKYTLNSGKRACFVIYNHKHKNSTDTEKRVLLLGKTNDAITITFPDNYTSNGAKCDGTIYYNNGNFREYYMGQLTDDNGLNSVNTALSKSGTAQDYVNSLLLDDDDEKTRLLALAGLYYRSDGGGYGSSTLSCGVPSSASTLANPYLFGFNKLPEDIPVFDLSDTNAVANVRSYLDNGDSSHSVDPFDPNNPSIKTVTNFKSDFKTYVTRSGKDVTLKTIAYNSQYISMGDDRDDEYGIYCFKRSAGSDGQYGNWSFVSKATQVSYPTINIKPVFTTGAPYLELFYGFAKVGDDTRTYGFSIRLESDSAKEYGFKIKEVHCYGDFWHSSTYTGTSRTSITDGYQYTQQTDNKYMQVLFRAVTLDDLHDTADDGYDDKSDTEDTSTGTTAQEVCGHGLGTYKISQEGFDAINDALWSTDWSQLFKSNTIDPVKCVISCKGIPFAHSGTATDAVYIANQRVVCSAGKCNPVNTYNIGSYTIQAINNNFTDMTMTKVRVYLPYVGWVELPAEEVISRVGRAEVGLSSVTKLLNFKYIVDFVDGSCRCVISVNGTERWFFDGACGVDIPVTSDNHTSAINNAIKSGVATVMNVGLAVASAYGGNAMGVASGVTGAISSMANTIPTYNYSATANSSGYINHSMGNKIIIVIESPNIQMPNGYGHKYGFPCMRNLTLGSLSGYTKCESVDLTGINGTNYELNYIKSALESGVYL